MHILKWTRRTVAILLLTLFVISFMGVANPTEDPYFFLVERIQFIPACLGTWSGVAWASIILTGLLVLTLLFGRVYCSWLCPLGILQDIAHRICHPSVAKLKPAPFPATPNHWVLRTISAAVVFGSLLIGGSILVLTWLDPYSISARFLTAVIHPLIHFLCSGEADGSRYELPLLIASSLSIAIVLTLALFRGRLYCNTICPVGAILGLLSRIAPCTPHIAPDKCRRCASCMRQCKAHAIDLKTLSIDSSLCVGCYDCLSTCANHAIGISWHSPFQTSTPPGSRRGRRQSRSQITTAKTSLPIPRGAPFSVSA